MLDLEIEAGPLDKEKWVDRLKEEYKALITYIKSAKENQEEWFKIKADKDGINWTGNCWYMHNLEQYEFEFEFEIPATYPHTPIEIKIPELDGKTPKMYRGGKICIDIHFAPLWRDKAPKFAIIHALVHALAPWLAAEIPILVEQGKI